MIIETWRKVYNRKIIDITVKHDDWWYQAFVNEKPITKADGSLENLHDILYGNGCQREIKENTFEEKCVDLMYWQKIDWSKIF